MNRGGKAGEIGHNANRSPVVVPPGIKLDSACEHRRHSSRLYAGPSVRSCRLPRSERSFYSYPRLGGSSRQVAWKSYITGALNTDYAPFSVVLPRCAAAVHHAGDGTTVAVIQAGIPHVVVPRAFDQPDTAARIERLGIGVAIPWRRRHRDLPRGLERVLSDRSMRNNAEALRHRLADERGAAAAADAIEACHA